MLNSLILNLHFYGKKCHKHTEVLFESRKEIGPEV